MFPSRSVPIRSKLTSQARSGEFERLRDHRAPNRPPGIHRVEIPPFTRSSPPRAGVADTAAMIPGPNHINPPIVELTRSARLIYE